MYAMQIKFTTTLLSAWLYKMNQWSGTVLTPGFQLEEKLPVTSGFLEAITCFYRVDYDTILSNYFPRKPREKKEINIYYD